MSSLLNRSFILCYNPKFKKHILLHLFELEHLIELEHLPEHLIGVLFGGANNDLKFCRRIFYYHAEFFIMQLEKMMMNILIVEWKK